MAASMGGDCGVRMAASMDGDCGVRMAASMGGAGTLLTTMLIPPILLIKSPCMAPLCICADNL